MAKPKPTADGTPGGSAHVTTNTGVSKGSAAEGRMGVESWVKVVRGAVWCGGGSWGALVSGGWRTSQAAAHRAGSTAMVGGAGASFP